MEKSIKLQDLEYRIEHNGVYYVDVRKARYSLGVVIAKLVLSRAEQNNKRRIFKVNAQIGHYKWQDFDDFYKFLNWELQDKKIELNYKIAKTVLIGAFEHYQGYVNGIMEHSGNLK